MASAGCEHLVVVHYHLRPGGVRRVIETALPEIVRAGAVSRVTLWVGEGGEEAWVEGVRGALGGVRLDVVVDLACGYWNEMASGGQRPPLPGIGNECVVWGHNVGLGRNFRLARELVALAARGVRVVSHHHDFWFENRWGRWEEMRAAGAGGLAEVGRVLFSPALRHAVINERDARGFDGAVLLTNPVRFSRRDAEAQSRTGKVWLRELVGDDGAVWVAATRLLRRKNLAEAILIHRWLRPDGWLVTTGGVSSAAEADYARALQRAARDGEWRVRFSVLADGGGPEVEELVAGCEAVVMTSVQEGFGLTVLEAAAAGKPLVARRLPNVTLDLEARGFEFPQSYDEVWIAAGLVDLEAEARRQAEIFARWLDGLPEELRGMAEVPRWWAGERLGFGRLTLEGQLEVLAVDPAESWAACKELNPGMEAWRGGVRAAALPEGVELELSVEAYAERFWEVSAHAKARRREGDEMQMGMMRERLGAGFLYPILMA